MTGVNANIRSGRRRCPESGWQGVRGSTAVQCAGLTPVDRCVNGGYLQAAGVHAFCLDCTNFL
jgi:hypothetical protein